MSGFEFTCSPLLREASSVPFPLSFSSVPATPDSSDGLGGTGTLARDNGYGGSGSCPFGLTSLANGTLGQERNTGGVSTFSALSAQGLDFPLPSALGPEVRNPATFGLYPSYISTTQPTPLPSLSTDSANAYGGVYGYTQNQGFPPKLPPLRLPDRPSLSNPPSSISATTGGIHTTASSPRYYGQGQGQTGMPSMGGLQQPPPHTYPHHSHSHSSSGASSEHLETPTAATGYSISSSYLTPPGSGQLPALNTTSMTLPGVGSILPLPLPQLHLPPTTVEPKAIQDPRFRSSYGYLTEPNLRGSSSTLSLFDSVSRHSHSVSPGGRFAHSRSTSVDSASFSVSVVDCGGPQQALREFEPHYPTALGGISKMDIERMKHDGLGQFAGGVYYTDDAEAKRSPTIKRKCHNCDHRSPPSWRKSVLNPGKILCNKCGIYERTHQRPRPPQSDHLKLRRHPSPPPISEWVTDTNANTSMSTSTGMGHGTGTSMSMSEGSSTSVDSAYSSPNISYSQTQTPLSPMIPTSTSGSMQMQMHMDERTNLEPYPSHTYLMNERVHPQVQGQDQGHAHAQSGEHPNGNTQSQLPSITSFWARRDPSSSLTGVRAPGFLTRISSARGGDGGDAGSGSGTGIGNGPVAGNGSGSGSGMRVYGYASSNARDLGYSPYPRPSHKRSR